MTMFLCQVAWLIGLLWLDGWADRHHWPWWALICIWLAILNQLILMLVTAYRLDKAQHVDGTFTIESEINL